MDSLKSIQKGKGHPDLTSAVDWLIESGIQSENGAFHSWYDCDENEYSFIYPETTGYSISLLLQLYHFMGNEIFLKRAISAGDWLLEIQREDGSFYSKYFDNTFGNKNCDTSLYTFDAAICASGLLDLFKATSHTKYLRASRKIGNWLIEHQNSDGSFVAALYPGGEIIENSKWSQMPSCHHLKIISTLLKLYDVLKEEKFLISAKKVLEWGQKLELNSGRFIISFESEETYTHAHNYALEAMLKASEFFNDTALLKNAARGAIWLSTMQNDDGSFWNFYNSKRERMKVSDATAQALRIWLILDEKGITCFSGNIEKSLRFLAKMQCSSHDKHSSGGILYGQQKKNKIKHANSWATIFTVQALLFKQEKGNPSSTSMLI